MSEEGGVRGGWAGGDGGGEKLQFYGGKLNQLCDGSLGAKRLGVSSERLLPTACACVCV